MSYRVLTNVLFLLFCSIFYCCNNEYSSDNTLKNNSSYIEILTNNEIKSFVEKHCKISEKFGTNKNLCFYNDKGFVKKIDFYRFNICEEMIYNKPTACITNMSFYTYYEDSFEECSFKWNYKTAEYILEYCFSYLNKDFEDLAKRKITNK